VKPPAFWTPADGHKDFRSALLSPLGWIYKYFVARRIQTTEPFDPHIPVICVGNATLGGTGKTPVVIYILKSLRRLGIDAVGLTRGYGGTEKGPVVVHKKHSAADIGDEPLLLARHAPVWVSAARDDGARTAAAYGAHVLVMDDGHQNPLVKKTLSLLVVDAETGFGNGCVFPAGPLREDLGAALSRSDAIILMKPAPDYEISEHLKDQLKGQLVIPAYLAPATPPPKGKLFAFAGIGRPEKFFKALRAHGGDVVNSAAYADHYKYKDADIEGLFLLASEYEAGLITTEKDYVRLPKGYCKGVTPWPVSVVFEDELSLRRLLHPIVQNYRI
jgi:tetraacyldisaccharide 4'-kinase